MNTLNPVVTLAALELEPFEKGDRYASQDADVAGPLALTQIGCALTVVPPGKSACPFHVHHVEDEMFVVLAGRGEYRFGDAVYPVEAGDVLGAPRGGRDRAHKLTNTGDEPLRYLSISSKSDVEVCEYPDSGKFMVSSGRGRGHALRFVGYRDDSCDYWRGELSD